MCSEFIASFYANVYSCVCMVRVPLVGPSVPPVVSYTKRSCLESEQKEECENSRKLLSSTSKGDVPASPQAAPERKKSVTSTGVRTCTHSLTLFHVS